MTTTAFVGSDANLASGTDGQALIVDSSKPNGLTFGAPSSGGAVTPGQVWWSPAKMAEAGLFGFTPTRIAGSQTCGVAFHVLDRAALNCTGVRFYWKRGTADRTVAVKIWHVTNADGFSTGVELATVDVAVTADGVYTGTFAAAQAISANDRYIVSFWEKSGTDFTQITTSPTAADITKGVPPAPFIQGPFLLWVRGDRFVAGNAFPGSGDGGHIFPVEPVIT